MKQNERRIREPLQRSTFAKGVKKNPPEYGLSFIDTKARTPIVDNTIVQRVPVGTGAGTDDDRNAIRVENLAADENIRISGDNNRRARVENLVVNGHNYANRVLKHYMVVRNNWRYQFPIKHVREPRLRVIGGVRYSPNQGVLDANRGGQPEPFGGNTDQANTHGVFHGDTLYNTRGATLDHEYQEENHNHGGANLNVVRSQKFGSAFGVGTLSIAESNQALPAHSPNSLLDDPNRGRAEMAGTVSIDCSDLIERAEVGDALEQLISAKITAARNAFYVAHGGHDPRGERQLADPFSSQAGIVAHLVGLVAVDIEAERARRAAAAAEQRRRDQAAQQRLMIQISALIVLLCLFGYFVGVKPVLDLFKGVGDGKGDKPDR